VVGLAHLCDPVGFSVIAGEESDGKSIKVRVACALAKVSGRWLVWHRLVGLSWSLSLVGVPAALLDDTIDLPQGRRIRPACHRKPMLFLEAPDGLFGLTGENVALGHVPVPLGADIQCAKVFIELSDVLARLKTA